MQYVAVVLMCLVCWNLSLPVAVVGRPPKALLRNSPQTRGHPKLRDDDQLSPVILLPGDGGSQLEAKLDKPSAVNCLCQKKSSGWIDLWLNIEALLPAVLDCWVDNMRLVYNNVTEKTENSPGVDVRVVGFGTSRAVEYIDPSRVFVSRYFVDIANMLVNYLGYQRDVSIRGAPYDFRKAPNELDEYFGSLKQLVEETYEKNNQTAVTFIGHSMGGLIGQNFLQQRSSDWKAKYMSSFITLGAPWGGAVKAMKAMASGDNLNVALVSALRVRAEQRTNPGLTALFPNSNLWDRNQTFVVTPTKMYSLSNLEDFFSDLGYEDGWEMYKRSANSFTVMSPGIPVYCIYGTGVGTPVQMVYRHGQFPDRQPKVRMGDGDGTVNRNSLEVCGSWPDTVDVFTFDKVSHSGMLSDPKVLETIESALLGILRN